MTDKQIEITKIVQSREARIWADRLCTYVVNNRLLPNRTYQQLAIACSSAISSGNRLLNDTLKRGYMPTFTVCKQLFLTLFGMEEFKAAVTAFIEEDERHNDPMYAG